MSQGDAASEVLSLIRYQGSRWRLASREVSVGGQWPSLTEGTV